MQRGGRGRGGAGGRSIGGVGSRDGKHTILLIQQTKSLDSRTYTDHDSVTHAMQALMKTYETALRAQRGDKFTYDSNDLFNFIDSLNDISMLVYEDNLNAYSPYDRAWIKNKLYAMLKRQAN